MLYKTVIDNRGYGHDDDCRDDTAGAALVFLLGLGLLGLVIPRRLVPSGLLILRLRLLILRLLVLRLWLVCTTLRRILGLIPLRSTLLGRWLRLLVLGLRLWLLVLGLRLRLRLNRLRLWVRVLPAGQHHLASHLRGFDHIWSRLGLRRLERRPWLLNRLRPDLKLRQWLDRLRLRLWLRLHRLRLNRLRLGLNRWIGGSGYRLRLSAGGTKPGVVGELGSTIETVFHSL